jgi:hypothetical protein
MADVPVSRYQQFCTEKRKTLFTKYPDAEVQLKQMFKILCDIEVVADHTPASVGEVLEQQNKLLQSSHWKAPF